MKDETKQRLKQHGPLVGVGVLAAAAFLRSGTNGEASKGETPISSSPVPTNVVSSVPRCSGVEGSREHGIISVWDADVIDGCWIRFMPSFEHDPSCGVKLQGGLDSRSKFESGSIGYQALKDRLIVPHAKHGMRISYDCK